MNEPLLPNLLLVFGVASKDKSSVLISFSKIVHCQMKTECSVNSISRIQKIKVSHDRGASDLVSILLISHYILTHIILPKSINTNIFKKQKY